MSEVAFSVAIVGGTMIVVGILYLMRNEAYCWAVDLQKNIVDHQDVVDEQMTERLESAIDDSSDYIAHEAWCASGRIKGYSCAVKPLDAWVKRRKTTAK